MTKSCPVLGCKSIRAKGSLHFFRFPKVSKKFGDIGRVSLSNLCFCLGILYSVSIGPPVNVDYIWMQTTKLTKLILKVQKIVKHEILQFNNFISYIFSYGQNSPEGRTTKFSQTGSARNTLPMSA